MQLCQCFFKCIFYVVNFGCESAKTSKKENAKNKHKLQSDFEKMKKGEKTFKLED